MAFSTTGRAQSLPTVCLRIIILEVLRDRRKLGLRLLAGNARFQKRVTFNPARPAIFEFVAGRIKCLLHRRRHPEVKRISDESAVKFFRRDANDRVLNAVEILRFADDRRVALVTVLPG